MACMCKWPLLGVAVTAVVLAALRPRPSRRWTKKRWKHRHPAICNKLRQPDSNRPVQPQAGTHGELAESGRASDNPRGTERLKRENPDAAAAEKTEVANAFNAVSWYEPPPAPPAPVEAPEPIVPNSAADTVYLFRTL